MIHGRTRAVGRDGGGSGWFPGTGWYFGDSCVHRGSMKTRGSNTPTRWYSLTRDWRTSSRPVFLVRPILSCEHFLVFAAIFRNNFVHVKRSAQIPMDESQRWSVLLSYTIRNTVHWGWENGAKQPGLFLLRERSCGE